MIMATAASYIPSTGVTSLSPLARSLAMPADTVRRLCAASVAISRPRAEIVAFVQPDQGSPGGPLTLQQAAAFYLSMPDAPAGYAKSLAAANGLNYGSLLATIGKLRQSGSPASGFQPSALPATAQAGRPAPGGEHAASVSSQL